LVAAGLAACAQTVGEPSAGFLNDALAASYHPLSGTSFLVAEHWGAGITIAPNIAVTNAHNANLLPESAILGRSRDYDLLFYRVAADIPAPMGHADVGAPVVAYGQGGSNELREAKGVIRALQAPVAPRCPACNWQYAIAFDAAAGPGFSGGPVVDARSGAVVGLVFGYRDGDTGAMGRRMFAYDIALVMEEMRRLVPARQP
jgi:S1-C subfamily serine protease